jgi:hypothetical protein
MGLKEGCKRGLFWSSPAQTLSCFFQVEFGISYSKCLDPKGFRFLYIVVFWNTHIVHFYSA